MNTFRSLFPFAFPSSPQDLITRKLDLLQISISSSLPQNYQDIIFPKEQNSSNSFSQLLSSLPTANTATIIVKLFTIILKTIRAKNYNKELLDQLEFIETPNIIVFIQQDSWVGQLIISIKSFLARIPSVEDVFQRALKYRHNIQIQYLPLSIYLSDLYRFLNVFALLFPAATNSLNTIGRYYLKTSQYFIDFYKALNEHLIIGYEYIQFIVSLFKKRYNSCDPCTLACFLNTVPALQLYCDRTQEYMMNKYFKGKGPTRKIYFKQEEIQQLNYYLKSKQQIQGQVDGDQEITAEEIFGEFQQ